jgi:hypothetical protein
MVEQPAQVFVPSGKDTDELTLGRAAESYRRRREGDRDRLACMIRFAQSTRCRIQILLEYFGEKTPPLCRRCDNCTNYGDDAAVERAPELAAPIEAAEDEDMSDTHSQSESPKSFEEFWPHYVRAHQHPVNRALHFVGLTLAMRLGLKGIRKRRLGPLLLAPVVGYGLSWIGHFVCEHNKPASFGNPLWSLRGDFRMWSRIAQRKMGDELDRAAANP